MSTDSRLFISETEHGMSLVEWYNGRVAGAVFVSNNGHVSDETDSIADCGIAHSGCEGKEIAYLEWSSSWTETDCPIDRDFYMSALFCLKEGETSIDSIKHQAHIMKGRFYGALWPIELESEHPLYVMQPSKQFEGKNNGKAKS